MDFVKKLIDEKVSDEMIQAEKSVTLSIGPDKRKLTIRCLPMAPWARFQKMYGVFLVAFYNIFSQYEWPEWDDYKEDKKLARFQLLIESCAVNTHMRKAVMQIIRRTILRDPINAWVPAWQFWRRWRYKYRWGKFRAPGWRYFKRHVTAIQVMKIFLVSYLFNIAAVKKNARFLAERAGVDLDASLFSSLRGLGGPMGKLLRPLFPNSPYLSRDGASPTSPLRILSPEEIASQQAQKGSDADAT